MSTDSILDQRPQHQQKKRKTDLAAWVQTSVAILGISAAFFAWYTNQASMANAQEVVSVHDKSETAHVPLTTLVMGKHNDRADSHYDFRADVVETQNQQARSIIEIVGSTKRIEDSVASNKEDITELKANTQEILRLVRRQSSQM